MLPKIFIKKGFSKRVKNGHLWLFSNELNEIPSYKPGSLVEVIDSNNSNLGRAFYNPNSLISIRLLNHSGEIDEQFFINRLTEADNYRKLIYPNEEMYRMVFSESDYLPGLIIDRYNDCFAVQILSAGMELLKDLIFKALLVLYPGTKGIIEKNMSQIRKLEGLENFEIVNYGEIPDEIICSENGIKLSVSLIDSQKTGYFIDQRDNRNFIQKISNELNVLDCYSNQGGFALNALKGGASYVTSIDISQPALDKISRNMVLNNFQNFQAINSDVIDYLQNEKSSGNKFDMIILDPPAFTKNKKTIHTAIAGYRKINKLAIEILHKNGFLVTSSCSHHLLEDRFFQLIINEATRIGRKMTLVFRGMQAMDHPVHLSMPESQYLKFFVFQMKN